MSTQPKPFLTPEQYLEIERRAETKSEYYNGEMFGMAGTSFRHSQIVMNIGAKLIQKLQGRCNVVGTDVRLTVTPPYYTYPDVMVICGRPNFIDSELDTVTNPTVIIEILSPSTEAYDRGKKFESYRKLASLQDYILIAQDRVHLEHYTRQSLEKWTLQEASDPDATVEIPSIACGFKLADAYRNVEFDAPATPTPPSSPPQS